MAVGAPPADRSHVADGATRLAAIEAFLAATAAASPGWSRTTWSPRARGASSSARCAGEVHLWHGMGDAFVPVEHALQLAAALPRCRVSLDPGEGHFFFRRRVRAILAQLAAPVDAEAWRSRRANPSRASVSPS